MRRKPQAAVLLRNNHCEEFVFLDELPGVLRHISELVADLPLVEHRAQFFAGAVEKRLLFFG